MISAYDNTVLKQRLHAGNQIDMDKAIYTLVRHIEQLEDRIAELERQLEQTGSAKR